MPATLKSNIVAKKSENQCKLNTQITNYPSVLISIYKIYTSFIFIPTYSKFRILCIKKYPIKNIPRITFTKLKALPSTSVYEYTLLYLVYLARL